MVLAAGGPLEYLRCRAGRCPLVWLKKVQLRSFACSRPERHSFALCRGPWNAFDFVMVLAGYTAFIPMGGGSSNTGAIRALRALRALRPLRTITRFESLRSIIVCFLEVRCGQSWAALRLGLSRLETVCLGGAGS